MRVDDALFGQLAQPRERIAIAQVEVRQRRDGAQAQLLQDVGRLELASQRCAEIAADKGKELRPPELDDDERILVFVADSIGKVCGEFVLGGEVPREGRTRAGAGRNRSTRGRWACTFSGKARPVFPV